MAITPGTPAYLQVASVIRAQIGSGELAPGDRLATMSQMQTDYDVSSTVIREALKELRREGLIIGQQGKGTYVADTHQQGTPDEDLAAQVRRLTQTVSRLDGRVSQLEGHNKGPT